MDEEKLQWAMNNVDATIGAFFEERQWEQYVPKCDTELFHSFCRHLMYVITKFLEESDKQELLIQIPIEDFANLDEEGDDTLQIQRWKVVVNAIYSCLSLATSSEQMKLADVNEPYSNGDTFLCMYGNKNTIRACKYLAHDKSFRELYGDLVTFFKKSYCKVRCNHEIAEQINNGKIGKQNQGKLMEDLLGIQEKLEKFANHGMKKQYKAAALVSQGSSSGESLSPTANLLHLSYNIITPTVDYFINSKRIPDKYDVLVVMGDSKFAGIDNPKAKKIIYLASNSIEGVEKYAFTFREMYRYCQSTPNDESMSFFNNPTIIKLRFEWLETCGQELRELLNQCAKDDVTVTPQVQNKVWKVLLSLFTSADFSSEYLMEIKRKWDWERVSDLFEDPDTEINTVDCVSNWIQNLEYDGINPKRSYMNENPYAPSFSRGKSYKNFVKKMRGSNNSIILDNLGCHRNDDRYTFILRHHLFMNITSLYYEGFEEYSIKSLERYINSEYNCYSSSLRKSLKTEYVENIQGQPAENTSTLDDFLFDIEDNVYGVYGVRDATTFKVEFSDGTKEDVDGDVLLDGKTISMGELWERGNYQGQEITYYKTSENLDELMRESYDLPFDDIDKYSNLWKKAFVNRFTKLCLNYSESQAINILHRECKLLSKSVIRKYTTETSHQFLKVRTQMDAVCKYLYQQGLISESERKYVLAAYSASQMKKSFGKDLKKEILNLCADKNYRSERLTSLLTKYSKDDLLSTLTRTKVINDIIIK